MAPERFPLLQPPTYPFSTTDASPGDIAAMLLHEHPDLLICFRLRLRLNLLVRSP